METVVQIRKPRTRSRVMPAGWINTYVPVAERRALIAEARATDAALSDAACVGIDYGFPTGARLTFNTDEPAYAGMR